MAKPRCDKHKRSIPYCDACKAAVRAAEEAALQAERDAVDADAEDEEEARAKQAVLDEALREEESSALEEGVGFPGAESQPADPEGPLPEGGPDAEPAPVGGMFPPDEPADWDKAIDQAGETFNEGENTYAPEVVNPIDVNDTEKVKEVINEVRKGLAEEFPDPCEGCPGGCASSCQGHPDPGAEFVTVR
ncbi:hypothetical protein LCGC14_2315270 [marine sediment metagenome]|uniref:Uncharacterized protein n=1 Tax=marine sediment metagenome TaxID=412755 RepID=A0A0F9CJH8_9ZZZZ